jgi:hypothetical protein
LALSVTVVCGDVIGSDIDRAVRAAAEVSWLTGALTVGVSC